MEIWRSQKNFGDILHYYYFMQLRYLRYCDLYCDLDLMDRMGWDPDRIFGDTRSQPGRKNLFDITSISYTTTKYFIHKFMVYHNHEIIFVDIQYSSHCICDIHQFSVFLAFLKKKKVWPHVWEGSPDRIPRC